MKIDLNKITVDQNLIKTKDIGNHTITLRLTSNDNIMNEYNFTLTIKKQKVIYYNQLALPQGSSNSKSSNDEQTVENASSLL